MTMQAACTRVRPPQGLAVETKAKETCPRRSFSRVQFEQMFVQLENTLGHYQTDMCQRYRFMPMHECHSHLMMYIKLHSRIATEQICSRTSLTALKMTTKLQSWLGTFSGK